MNKNTWTWGIGVEGGDYYVYLEKGSLYTEFVAAFAGFLLNRGVYSLGNKLIWKTQRSRQEVMRLPITLDQARELGWGL